ncbi:hypothetical protein H5T89_01570 [bacterium]|nr:hypothetical protein [bacterium]
MGRIFCPECALEVDEIDGRCPYCGYVFSPKEKKYLAVKDIRTSSRTSKKDSNMGCRIIIGIFLVIFLFISFLSCRH